MMGNTSTWCVRHVLFWYASVLLLVSPAIFAGVDSGSIRDVEEPYVRYGCYQCHGFKGQGALMTSTPPIAPDVLPFEAFAEIVRRPYGKMPAYSPDVLDRQTLKQIYEYLESVKRIAEQEGDSNLR